jgi:hypothetical protein
MVELGTESGVNQVVDLTPLLFDNQRDHDLELFHPPFHRVCCVLLDF